MTFTRIAIMRLRKIQAPCTDSILIGLDGTRFTLNLDDRHCGVSISWADGTAGPDIAFLSEADARLWVHRDAPAWIQRMALASMR